MNRTSFGYSNSPDARIGENPYDHLSLLADLRCRTQYHCSLFKKYVKPGMSVLDIGCGSLGIFSIIASKLGAGRIVGLDQGNVMIAAAVAADNNVHNIEWISSRIEDFTTKEKFDLLSGTFWLDDMWDNAPIINVYKNAIQKFANPDAVILPNKLNISATAIGIDYDSQTLVGDLIKAEEDTGLILDFLRKNKDGYFYKQFLLSSRTPRVVGKQAKIFTVDESISSEHTIATVDFYQRDEVFCFPKFIKLNIKRSGLLCAVQWNQQISDQFSNDLFRSIVSTSDVYNPRYVTAGESISIEILDKWERNQGKVRII